MCIPTALLGILMDREPFQLTFKETAIEILQTIKSLNKEEILTPSNYPRSKDKFEALWIPTDKTCIHFLSDEKCMISLSTRVDWTGGKVILSS